MRQPLVHEREAGPAVGQSVGFGGSFSDPPPDSVAIEHPTGATDVVLRFEVSGGFVMPEFLATQAPIFTLYGDRTVIFRNTNQESMPAIGSVQPARPLRIARLSEDQVQAVLADALGPGGLALARADYTNRPIMDLPTAYFTINAGGISKRVAITGLGIDIGSSPDAPALAAFAGLSTRLGDFDNRRLHRPDRRARGPDAIAGEPARRPARRTRREGLAVDDDRAGRLRDRSGPERVPAPGARACP